MPGWGVGRLRWFEGSDLDAVTYCVEDNRTDSFSEWDGRAVARLLEQLCQEDALDGVGFDEAEIERLVAQLDVGEPNLV